MSQIGINLSNPTASIFFATFAKHLKKTKLKVTIRLKIKMPCAVITGVSGQDGSYLAELLLEKGYRVFGMIRRSSSMLILDRLHQARQNPNLNLSYGDVCDYTSVFNLLRTASEQPDATGAPIEVYNLAAQSHVHISFQTPFYTSNINTDGLLHILDATRQLNLTHRVRVYQASTSEMFGSSPPPQSESTPFAPCSPYAASKLHAHHLCQIYRQAYNMYIVSGIMFNHESERRGETFVTRKVTRAVASLAKAASAASTHPPLTLGNLNAHRDWGYAKDYVLAMWLMLQQPQTHLQDGVIATGESHTIREFVEAAFSKIGKRIVWRGTGLDEKGYDADDSTHTSPPLIQVDAKYFRPFEVENLRGDASKMQKLLNWKPKVTFDELVDIMVAHDLNPPPTH